MNISLSTDTTLHKNEDLSLGVSIINRKMVPLFIYIMLSLYLCYIWFITLIVNYSKQYRDIYVLVQYRDYRKENWVRVIGIYDQKNLALQHIPEDYEKIDNLGVEGSEAWEKPIDEEERIILRLYGVHDVIRKTNVTGCFLTTLWGGWKGFHTNKVEVEPLGNLDQSNLILYSETEEDNYQKETERTLIVLREMNLTTPLK